MGLSSGGVALDNNRARTREDINLRSFQRTGNYDKKYPRTNNEG
jgi:hypothetical protein